MIDGSRMYWVHRVREGKARLTAASPDLGNLLAKAGLSGRRILRDEFMAMHGAGPEG